MNQIQSVQLSLIPRKVSCAVMVCSLCAIFSIAQVAAAETIQPENFKQLSGLYLYNDENPYISGDFVVWGAKPGSPISTVRHIMLYDLLKNKEIQITNNSFENASPAVDGKLKLIVYKSFRNNLYGIYLCEYNPAGEICPEVKITEDTNYKLYTEIEGNRIVWVEYAQTVPYRRIYSCDYDFAGHCSPQLVAGGQSISRPNLAGNLLLWEDRTNYDGGTLTEHLFLHDFATGNTYDLDKGDNEVGNMAAVDGNTIIWAKQKYNTSLQRWERVMVRCEYMPQNAPNVCVMQEIDTTMGKTTLYSPSHPSISGKRVVYRNDLVKDPNESVFSNADIYHYNLETGEILRVTTETASQHMPMISGNRLVWRESLPNNILVIRLYEFKMPNQAPVLASIGNKTVDDSVLLQFQVSSTDADNDPLSFTHPMVQDLPAGVSFNTTLNQAGHLEGIFSWTPGANQRGNHYVLFEASDGKAFSSELVTINVAQHLYCGDGIVNGSEQCDGTAGVGVHQTCSSTCTLTTLPYCGDGVVNGSEQCDGTSGVGAHQTCSGACTLTNLPYCGDGIVNGSEQCDGTAGIGAHQECSLDCKLVNLSYCGDGIKNGSEQCDGFAGINQGQICSSSCIIVEQGIEICHRPPGNPGNVQTIKISADALKAHLEHGDTMGVCAEENLKKNKAEDNYVQAKNNYEKAKTGHYNAMQLQKQEGFQRIVNDYQTKLLKEEYNYRRIRDELASAMRAPSRKNDHKAMNEYKAKLAKEEQGHYRTKDQITQLMQIQKNECSQKAINEYKAKMVKEEEIYGKARDEYYRVMQAEKK